MNCAVHTQTQATAFCRTCGKALCEDCKRDVMGAIYCEPCIAARLHGQAPAGAVVPPPVAAVHGAPNPVMAGILGFIPGVGAMYNGQFVKAFAHVVIFVLLILAANSMSGLFGILIGFFVIYMAFEAYKTAEAHRHGFACAGSSWPGQNVWLAGNGVSACNHGCVSAAGRGSVWSAAESSRRSASAGASAPAGSSATAVCTRQYACGRHCAAGSGLRVLVE